MKREMSKYIKKCKKLWPLWVAFSDAQMYSESGEINYKISIVKGADCLIGYGMSFYDAYSDLLIKMREYEEIKNGITT